MDRKSEHHAPTTRRRLLRAAGAAAVGTVGAAAVTSSAAANPGDPVLLGHLNDAGTAGTTISGLPYEFNGSAVYGPMLSVGNPSGAPLRLQPTEFSAIPTEGDLGLIAADPDGDVQVLSAWPFLDENGDEQATIFPALLYNSRWATCTVPVTPTRVFDTRDPSRRANIVSGAGAIDSAGVVPAGTTLVISLDSYVDLGAAVHANLTVTRTQGAGYVTVWGTGPRPTASSVNWWTGGQTLANAVLSPLGPWGPHTSTIAIYCQVGTALLMDLNAFEVGGPWQVLTDLPGASPAAIAQRRRRRPAWRMPVEPLQV